MKVTLLDTKTGEHRDCSGIGDVEEFGVYWWLYGNGSCDCNRSRAFDREGEDNHEEQRIAVGASHGECLLNRRWVIVDVSGGLEWMTRDEILQEANSEYCR